MLAQPCALGDAGFVDKIAVAVYGPESGYAHASLRGCIRPLAVTATDR